MAPRSSFKRSKRRLAATRLVLHAGSLTKKPKRLESVKIDGIDIHEFNDSIEMEFFTNLEEPFPPKIRPFRGFDEADDKPLHLLKEFFDKNVKNFIANGASPSKQSRPTTPPSVEIRMVEEFSSTEDEPSDRNFDQNGLTNNKIASISDGPFEAQPIDIITIESDSDDDVEMIGDPNVPIPKPQLDCVCPTCGKMRPGAQKQVRTPADDTKGVKDEVTTLLDETPVLDAHSQASSFQTEREPDQEEVLSPPTLVGKQLPLISSNTPDQQTSNSRTVQTKTPGTVRLISHGSGKTIILKVDGAKSKMLPPKVRNPKASSVSSRDVTARQVPPITQAQNLIQSSGRTNPDQVHRKSSTFLPKRPLNALDSEISAAAKPAMVAGPIQESHLVSASVLGDEHIPKSLLIDDSNQPAPVQNFRNVNSVVYGVHVLKSSLRTEVPRSISGVSKLQPVAKSIVSANNRKSLSGSQQAVKVVTHVEENNNGSWQQRFKASPANTFSGSPMSDVASGLVVRETKSDEEQLQQTQPALTTQLAPDTPFRKQVKYEYNCSAQSVHINSLASSKRLLPSEGLLLRNQLQQRQSDGKLVSVTQLRVNQANDEPGHSSPSATPNKITGSKDQLRPDVASAPGFGEIEMAVPLVIEEATRSVVEDLIDHVCLQAKFSASYQYKYDQPRTELCCLTVPCGEMRCRLGCVCVSLSKKSVRRVRCSNFECIFGCNCKSKYVPNGLAKSVPNKKKLMAPPSRRKQVLTILPDYDYEGSAFISSQTALKSYMSVQKLLNVPKPNVPKSKELLFSNDCGNLGFEGTFKSAPSRLVVAPKFPAVVRSNSPAPPGVKSVVLGTPHGAASAVTTPVSNWFMPTYKAPSIPSELSSIPAATNGYPPKSPPNMNDPRPAQPRRGFGREKVPIPEYALMCLKPGLGYVALDQLTPKVIIQDPFRPFHTKSFLDVRQATEWLNVNLANILQDQANLSWVVANKTTIEKRQLSRLCVDTLKNSA